MRQRLPVFLLTFPLTLVCFIGAPGSTVFAESPAADMPGVASPARAQMNYMLNCQGCHGAHGTGTADGAVPTMQNYLANFLSVAGGRAFLVQVPGSANAALGDEQLAEVLNWMLVTLSPAQLPADFQPYGADEVGTLRSQPLQDVLGERARLVAQMPPAALTQAHP
ncbi:MAG: cytochrome C [Pseudomonadota bacterium]